MESYITVMLQYINTSYDNNGNVAGKIPMTILLDAVNDVTVEESSNITAHPVVSGDMIADHMVREPASLTISGEISMNGSTNALIYPTKSSSTNRKPSLKYFQEIFKSIKDSASLCTISKLVSSTKEVRFLERENMALTSISWTERINSLGYRLTFKEVLTATTEVIPYTQVDENLPLQTNPNVLSFTSTLMDWNAVTAYVIQYMREKKIIEDTFWDYITSTYNTDAGSVVGYSLMGIGGIAVIAGLVAAGPVGWAIAIAGGIAIGVGFAVKAITAAIERRRVSREYAIEQFRRYKDDTKQKQEDARFYNFIGNIHKLLTEGLDQRFFLYKIPSNEAQECYLTIGDEYYDFKFIKNNTSGAWNINVTIPMRNDEVVVANKSIAVAKTSFDQCTSSNRLFKASGSGAYVYLVYDPQAGYDVLSTEYQRAMLEGKYKLDNYYILVCTMKPEEFNELMQQLVDNALLR